MKLSGMFFMAKVAGFLVSIAGDRNLTVDDLHKAIDHVEQYIDKDGDGVVLEMIDTATLQTLEGFVAALNEVISDGTLSVKDLHRVLDDTNDSHFAVTGEQLVFKF